MQVLLKRDLKKARKIIEKLGGEAYRVEQDGSIKYDDSENKKIKEFKEEK